jgi:FkbM family methyltransferase
MDKLKLENFDWGWMDEPCNEIYMFDQGNPVTLAEFHRKQIISEIFDNSIYEKFFEVSENDIVLDIGASHGPFTYSILHKKPRHVFCIEPSKKEFPILVKNTLGFPVTHINKGLNNKDEIVSNSEVFGDNKIMEGITFESLLKLYNLNSIDFLKVDCEGGEYDIFTEQNSEFILNNIKKITGEWHLYTPEQKMKFRMFRNYFVKKFDFLEVFSVDGVDIKWDLWNEHFIEYYNQVIFYIKPKI